MRDEDIAYADALAAAGVPVEQLQACAGRWIGGASVNPPAAGASQVELSSSHYGIG